MADPRSWDVPFDKAIVQALRERVDRHMDDPYGTDVPSINWLWFSRMVATMEKTFT